jgi:hypothetical protein
VALFLVFHFPGYWIVRVSLSFDSYWPKITFPQFLVSFISVDFIFFPFILTTVHSPYFTNDIVFSTLPVTHPAKMRRHKAVARILLFLSIFNFTFAGVTQTPTMDEMRVDLVTGAEDVTVASERGHTRSEELSEQLRNPSMAGHLHSRLDILPAAQSATTSSVDLEKKKFFNKELKRRMREYLVLGTVAGVFVGVANGLQKQIMGTVSPGAYVFTSPPPLLPTLEWRVSQTYSDYGISQPNGCSSRR